MCVAGFGKMLIRRLEGVAGRIQRVFLGERWEPSGPTNGRQDAAPVPEGPFPSYQFSLRNGKNRSRARGLCAACVPLTDFFRSGTWIRRERGRGSQGVSPWRSMRRRLIRAVRRAASLRRQSSLPTNSATEPQYENFRIPAENVVDRFKKLSSENFTFGRIGKACAFGCEINFGWQY